MFEYFFRNVVDMVSSSHDLDGNPTMVWQISSSVSAENLFRCGVPLGSTVYTCVPLKSFHIFCILLRKNATKSSASCWSDVDSGSGFCLVWPDISLTIFYSFLLAVVFILTRLCIKSHFLYLSIMTNLFCSLLNTFQCWSSLYLIHFFLCFS